MNFLVLELFNKKV